MKKKRERRNQRKKQQISDVYMFTLEFCNKEIIVRKVNLLLFVI